MTNAATAPKPIRLFRTGTFTSVEGVKVSLGESDLASIATSYDADANPAPLVIGHPQLNDPAYGWVDRLAVEGDELLAYPNPELTDPSFAEAVNAGRYAKVSAQFYPPAHPHNPTPDQFYLKHVGFLGAHAPGVKGLGRVSFAAGDAGDLITFEQEKTVDPINAPKDPADKDREASFAERERTVAEREAAVAAREKAAAEKVAAERHAANVSFAEGLFEQAKIKPAGKTMLVGVLDALDGDGVVSFGEGVELTPRAALMKILDHAQPLVSLGEAAPDDGKAPADLDPAEVAAEAASFAEAETKAGRPTSVAAAVRHVTSKKKGA